MKLFKKIPEPRRIRGRRVKTFPKMRILHDDLSPILRKRIGEKKGIFKTIVQALGKENNLTILSSRGFKKIGDFAIVLSLIGSTMGFVFSNKVLAVSWISALALGAFAKQIGSSSEKRLTKKIPFIGIKYGMLSTQNEEEYPLYWMNPVEIGKSHPVGCVDSKGNLVVMEDSPLNYTLWKMQRMIGSQMVFWKPRFYFIIPKNPQTIFQATVDKIRAGMAQKREAKKD